MREVDLDDEEAVPPAVIDAAARGEASIITRHGKPEAVVISFEEWRRLSSGVPSFGHFLMSAPIEPGDLPERDRSPLREVEF